MSIVIKSVQLDSVVSGMITDYIQKHNLRDQTGHILKINQFIEEMVYSWALVNGLQVRYDSITGYPIFSVKKEETNIVPTVPPEVSEHNVN
jgi:hypothetical protein